MGSTKEMRPNPLHWACFKGNLQIVQLLLKAGVHWEDIDSCGNNSVMLAAAGNFPDIFKKFLQFGVNLDCRNSRGHSAKDLTTHPEIINLITAHDKSLECPVSKQAFKEKEVKHCCWVCSKFVSGKYYKV
jgi:ankyrin repeat protein